MIRELRINYSVGPYWPGRMWWKPRAGGLVDTAETRAETERSQHARGAPHDRGADRRLSALWETAG
eukprot:3624114-Prymnesium_polylepis.4